MENNLLKKGYVMVSRALLQKVCEKQGAACCDEAAFLRVLINVNFKPTVVFCNGVELQCARGESVISFLGWADLFGWTRGRTRNFFKNHHVNPNFICESPDENGIASLVAQDFGIALVADVDAIHRDDICIRPLISAESFSHTVYMGYLRSRYRLPAVQRFLSFVKNMES